MQEHKQINFFELTLPHFKFTHRPIKLFEAFAGIGCQAMALNKLGIEYETVGISEIDKYAITSYNAIHGKTKNYGDICKMTHIPECDIFTWSFPCTDLSKAGKREGLQGGTRSGLVYEVLQLLRDTAGMYPHRHIPKNSKIHSMGITDYYSNGDKSKLPKVLIMENVPDLIQASFVSEFAEIRRELEELGYSNYVERLNAKDYGVAQNRDRVFMVSILGEWYYEFPQKIKLDKRLKDYLEDEVDEKYYLSDKMLKGMQETNFNTYSLENKLQEQDGVSATILARFEGAPQVIAIPEATNKGYALASDGDGVYLNRPHQKRGVVQKGMIQTLKTSGDDVGVVVKGGYIENAIKETIENNNNIIPEAFDLYNRKPIIDGISKTLSTTCGQIGSAGGMGISAQQPQIIDDLYENRPSRVYEETSPTLRADRQGLKVLNNLRIRKLSPREVWRLMGISDEDFDKASKVVSNSQLYKQAGNGIVVDVFAAILRGLFL